MRSLTLVAVLLGALARPVLGAEADHPGPVDVVREFYARDSIRAYEFYSDKLKNLFMEDERKAAGEVGCIDIAFYVNAQDTEKGWERTLRLKLLAHDKVRAEVKATFTNFGQQEIRYDLVREHGQWLIDDARSVAGKGWVLSKILQCTL